MFDTHHHVHNHLEHDPHTEARLRAMEQSLGLIHRNQETIMIDTSRILAEVARERTELASWKAMSAAKDKVISDQAQALKDAIAANDPAAIAAVQADLDAAATKLSADNDEAEAAIKANTPATPA